MLISLTCFIGNCSGPLGIFDPLNKNLPIIDLFYRLQVLGRSHLRVLLLVLIDAWPWILIVVTSIKSWLRNCYVIFEVLGWSINHKSWILPPCMIIQSQLTRTRYHHTKLMRVWWMIQLLRMLTVIVISAIVGTFGYPVYFEVPAFPLDDHLLPRWFLPLHFLVGGDPLLPLWWE